MESLAKADIFFFITSIAVIITSIVLTIAFVYVIKILRDVQYVTRRVRKEADEILADVHDARKFVKKEVKRAIDIKEIVGGIVKLVTNKGKKRSPRKKN